MYSIAIPLKDLTLKIFRQAKMYHQVTAYYHIIAYAWLDFVILEMEAMINYFLVENSGMPKGTLTSCGVQYIPAAVLYSTLLDRILRSYC